jgi:hypothetical protein
MKQSRLRKYPSISSNTEAPSSISTEPVIVTDKLITPTTDTTRTSTSEHLENHINDLIQESLVVSKVARIFRLYNIYKYLGEISGSRRKLQRYFRNKETRRKQNYRRNNSVNAVSSENFNDAKFVYTSNEKA